MRRLHLTPLCLRHHLVPSCLDVFVPVYALSPLCKTGGVMRFGEHFCAARFHKSGNCRGICVEIVLDFSFGAVGFLVTGAQRAGVKRSGESAKWRGTRRIFLARIGRA